MSGSRILLVSAKCSDMCDISIPHLNIDQNGYVPKGLSIGEGDYVALEINLDTGKIIGWKPLTDQEIVNIFKDDKTI